MAVHTIGIEYARDAVTATLLDRSGRLLAARRDPFRSGVRGARGAIVDPAEWISAAEYALSGALDSASVPPERIWGIGLAGPAGWIAIDPDLRPLSPVRVLDDPEPGELLREIALWLESDPRHARRLELILAPKDYLRLRWSGGIATDPANAAALDLLAADRADWDETKVAASPIPRRALPPVLDGPVPTGRLTEEGLRATRLASGTWIAAGTSPLAARMLAAGACRDGAAYLEPGPPPRLSRTVPAAQSLRVRGALPGEAIVTAPLEVVAGLGSEVEVAIIDFREGEDPAPLLEWAEARGLAVRYGPFAGRASAGGAVLALLACGVYRGVESLYRKAIRPLEAIPPAGEIP